jgi:hypothetical protein
MALAKLAKAFGLFSILVRAPVRCRNFCLAQVQRTIGAIVIPSTRRKGLYAQLWFAHTAIRLRVCLKIARIRG